MRMLIALMGCLIASLSCIAADTTAGRWEGSVQIPGFPLNVVVDLDHDASGVWIGSVIIPELNITGAQLTDIDVHDADVAFTIKGVLADPQAGPARFHAHLDAANAMAGNFTQAGNSAMFSVKRTGSAQVDLPVRSTAVAGELVGKWVGDYELMGYARHVTLTLANHDAAPASAEFIIVGKKVNNLPVDLITQDGAFLRIESHEIGINFEGRLRKDTGELSGTYEQGPFEVPFVLHRETGGT
jgi:hypothetical protein